MSNQATIITDKDGKSYQLVKIDDCINWCDGCAFNHKRKCPYVPSKPGGCLQSKTHWIWKELQ